MKRTETAGFVHLLSPFLATAWTRDRAMLAFLGLESGGRTDRHQHNNLLVPGMGARPAHRDEGGSRAQCRLAADGIDYSRPDGAALWRVRWVGEREIHLGVAALAAAAPVVALDPSVSPPTIWSAETTLPPPPASGEEAAEDRFALPVVRNEYRLPLLVHFPDYGLLRITAARGGVTCREEWMPSRESQGLNLGYANAGYHTRCLAYHRGHIQLTFVPDDDGSAFDLLLRVEEERGPEAPGCDFSGRQWDGLRRCWLNAFTLDRKTLTMGDNIVLGGIGHLSIHLKSDMAVFTPALMEGVSVHDPLRRALELTLTRAQGDNGDLNWLYIDPARRGEPVTNGFTDGAASNLVAVANLVHATGDTAFAVKHRGAIARAAIYLLSLDRDGDGILESAFHGNRLEEARTRNWWDNFAFGHKDAYFNLLARRALRRTAPLLRLAGDTELPERIGIAIGKLDAAFRRVFWNPDSGAYAGWISADGKIHDYLFTFVSAMAVNEGLVPREEARRILASLLERMEALGYDFRYGVPGNLVPVDAADTISWEAMGRWGVYENGGLCGQTAYHLIEALYRAGMREAAERILLTMVATFEREPTHSGVFPGYCRSVDWRTKEGFPCGYNYLADNYYFLLAAVTGHFGVRLEEGTA
jgi:hypothetical protein